MKIKEKMYDKLPLEYKKHFTKLINESKDEVLDNFPYTKSGIAVQRNGKGQKIGGKGIYSGAKGGIKEDLGYPDEGSASRFFYCAKVSPSERNIGFDKSSERQNNHPTLKPLSLMKYLVRLITPKNGVVLDPFMGSGTTGMACMLEGFNFIGIEREKEYFDIANVRVDYVDKNREEFLNENKKKSKSIKKDIKNKEEDLTIF